MNRTGEHRKSCVAALQLHAWHAAKAAQYLKKKKEGVEDTSGIAGMSQPDLVNSSIRSEELDFANDCPTARSDLLALKMRLKSAGSPAEVLNIPKFIAQGTAGWVFAAERKGTGQRRALKIIRMTQVRSGLREWYISKLMRKAGITSVVLTDEDVYVLQKKAAPDVVKRQLENAGPVPYYACFVQEFMSGGTIEGLAQKGKLTPALLLKSLAAVSATLAAMHKQRVQHCDVKPENVLLQMEGGELSAAKLCDLGSAELGDDPRGRAEDVRRFGVTLFALATGEAWTKNQLIRAKHEDLIGRMRAAAAGFPRGPMQRLPDALREILEASPSMARVAELMSELRGCL